MIFMCSMCATWVGFRFKLLLYIYGIIMLKVDIYGDQMIPRSGH